MRTLLSIVAALFVYVSLASAGTTGTISGEVKDITGAVIPSATVRLSNLAQGTENKSQSDANGWYTFPSLPVGRYDLQIEAPGFKIERRSGLVIDADSVLKIDAVLQVAGKAQEVTVESSAIRVETESTQMGEVLNSQTMTAVPLNGRSYTDLLALEPGIVPKSTQTPDSIIMAGATVAIAPSGGLNPGNQSISGQREDANGFMVNGGDVKELMNGGTLIVPNLDSIAEFRVLTNNFDAEYGNYSGGIVNVITKSGDNNFHGTAFEFLRNTDLDARNFFSSDRSFYRQNQFGGTIGGPIKKNKIFFFADYQATRTNQGIDTGLISVPSLANRMGDFSDRAASLSGSVGGPFFANLLSQKLGYAVSANEPYYTPGCASSSQCVFPNAIIPQQAWSEPAKHLLQYIPLPNIGNSSFSTGSQGEQLRDNKGSFRIDGNSARWGQLSAYYFIDDYFLDNPYPTGQGGASVPGFDAVSLGRGQLVNLTQTKLFGNNTVNELHLSYMRSANNVGQPNGGVGPSLASQGFVTGVGTPGIVPLAPSIEGIENVAFNSFVMGTPITNLTQANNTYGVMENFSKVLGRHTLKTGVQLGFEQVNVHPNPTFNGAFLFAGTETGLDFADFLIGVASNYNQADSQAYYERHKYAGGFFQDSWKIRNDLTLNLGVRWDLMQYWYEKYNQVPTFILGEQSVVFPTAPAGFVYPGDKGVPRTLVPGSNRFSPRLGLAYSPSGSSKFIKKLTGGPGRTSLRAGYGIYYSVIQGNLLAFDEPQPPYGLSYTSPGPPLFATPFVTASNGSFAGNPFPLTFPPLNSSPSHPDPNINFSIFEPISGSTAPNPQNTYPYSENYFFSLERQFSGNTLVSLRYVGSQTHHLPLVYSINRGDPALCLALSQPSAVAPGSPTCGPFGEDTTYITASGKVINGTRGPFGPAFGNDNFEGTSGNSSFNSFQASVRYSRNKLSLMAGYTFSKSMDDASSLADPAVPLDFNRMRGLSAFDLKHNLVVSYDYQLPLERLFGHAKSLATGWTISGITRLSSGFPVTLKGSGDNSLTGSIPNGVNNLSVDLPDYSGAPLNLNGNPRNGLPYFNVSAFQPNALGTLGTASRRFFYGPGMFNTDLAVSRSFQLTEAKALQFRLETFNTFNHTQFFGPAAVNGDIDSPLFGHVVQAATPRLIQLALKFTF